MNERKEVRGVFFSCGSALLRWKLAIIVSLACMVCAEGAVVSAQWIENPANGHWYRLSSNQCSWDAAQDEAVSLGGNLATVRNPAENEWLLNNLANPDNRWIGYYLGPNGWGWISNETVTYLGWCPGQPDNTNGNEDAVELKGTGASSCTAGGRWNDQNGGQCGPGGLFGIVERETPPVEFAFVATPEIAVLDDDPVASIASILISIDEATSPSPEISAISISLSHDPLVLENPTVEMSAILADLNGGTGPGFLAVNPCTDGCTIGMVFDVVNPCALVLPVSGGLDVATIDYDVTASAATAGVPLVTTVDFVDGLCTVQAPVNNTVSDCAGNSYPIDAANRFGATLEFVAEEQFMRPDCNVDGVYDIADAIKVLGYLFTGTAVPSCLAACDANADGGVDIGDAINVLNGLFVPGSPPIAEPTGACGFEPFTPTAGCVSYDGVCQ